MGYKGVRSLPLQLTAASQLERNRLVKIASGVPAYPGYGDTARGVVLARGDENDYETVVLPLVAPDTTFFVSLAGSVSAHGLVFPTGEDGKAKGVTGTVTSRSKGEPGSPAEGDKYIVPAGIDWEAGSNENKVATRGAADWAYAEASAGDIYFVSDESIYVIFNGTTWVEVKPVGKAAEAGVSGQDIVCYLDECIAPINHYQLPAAERSNAQIVCAGLSDEENDADAEVVIEDDRILATDVGIAVVKTDTAGTHVLAAVCTANTLTVTLSGNGGAGTVINYMVLRPIS